MENIQQKKKKKKNLKRLSKKTSFPFPFGRPFFLVDLSLSCYESNLDFFFLSILLWLANLFLFCSIYFSINLFILPNKLQHFKLIYFYLFFCIYQSTFPNKTMEHLFKFLFFLAILLLSKAEINAPKSFIPSINSSKKISQKPSELNIFLAANRPGSFHSKKLYNDDFNEDFHRSFHNNMRRQAFHPPANVPPGNNLRQQIGNAPVALLLVLLIWRNLNQLDLEKFTLKGIVGLISRIVRVGLILGEFFSLLFLVLKKKQEEKKLLIKPVLGLHAISEIYFFMINIVKIVLYFFSVIFRVKKKNMDFDVNSEIFDSFVNLFWSSFCFSICNSRWVK